MNNRRTALLLTFVLLVGIVVATGLWWRAQQRQYMLNRQLIAALVHADDRQALALVEAGADPNTRYKATPAPSLLQRVKQFLHPSPQPVNNSPTALSIRCGAPWNYEKATYEAQKRASDAPQLVEMMLRHGANFNAQDREGATPLYWAVCLNRRNTVSVLLEHGANVDSNTIAGVTPLMFAVRINPDPATVRLLLQHGANVNAQDSGERWTPLYFAVRLFPKRVKAGVFTDILQQLLAHGANPNLPNKQGDTALKFAQREKRSDLVALLKKGYAK